MAREDRNSIRASTFLKEIVDISTYFTLPDFIGSESLRKTNKQSKEAIRQITYLIKIISQAKSLEH